MLLLAFRLLSQVAAGPSNIVYLRFQLLYEPPRDCLKYESTGNFIGYFDRLEGS